MACAFAREMTINDSSNYHCSKGKEMALIKCEECSKEISDKATACPGCGSPVRLKAATKAGIVYDAQNQRRCLTCDYVGPMKTWLRNYNAPQFITLILLFFWIIPGLIFIAWGWGKHKCPRCGALDNSVAI